MNEMEMYINVLKGRASTLLLASVKKSHLLELRVVARNSRKNIHSYLEIEELFVGTGVLRRTGN